MIRKFVIGTAILSMMVIIMFGWLIYRQAKAYKHALPANADLIVRVNMDQLRWKIFKHFATKPSDWFSAKERKKDTVESEGKGFYIPANVFAFTVKGADETLYLSLPVDDYELARSFFSKQFKLDEYVELATGCVGQSSDRKAIVEIHEDRLVIGFALKKRTDKAQAEAVYQSLLSSSVTSEIRQQIKESSADVLVAHSQFGVDISLEGNKINAEAEFHKEGAAPIDLFEKTGGRLFSDSLITNHVTGFSLNVAETVLEQDTIIAYEYDDDFEKVEVKEPRTYRVPGIRLTINSDFDGLFALLEDRRIIVDDRLSQDIFPLSSLVAQKLEGGTIAFSNADINFTEALESDDIGMIKVDFESFAEEVKIPYLQEIIAQLTKMEVRITHDENESPTVNFVVGTKMSVIDMVLELVRVC